jgi:alanine racemase
MIDVTDIRNVIKNDEVVLLGKQGNDMITADELALRANTISYEILTTLGNKSERIYVKSH